MKAEEIRSVRLSKAELRQLERIATLREWSVAKVLHKAVEEFLKNNK